MPSKSERTDRTVPAFSPAIDLDTADLPDLPKPESIAPNIVVLAQNEKPNYVRLIRSGIVRLSFTNQAGEETIVGLRSEGWWMGGTLALLDLPSLCSIQTVTACQMSSIPAREFAASIPNNSRLLCHFLYAQSRELLMLQQSAIMRGNSAMVRLKHLQDESTQSIWDTADPNLVMKQSDIAKLLSITPEHLSRLRAKRPSHGSKDSREHH
jgi:CRP-like cAMP-binding protein